MDAAMFGIPKKEEYESFPPELSLREKDWWEALKNKEKLEDQNFGYEVLRDEIEPGYVDTATFMRPRVKVIVPSKSYSYIKNEEKCLSIKLSVEEYGLDGVRVKVKNNILEVNCKHDQKEERHGLVSREFTRSYLLPDECDTNNIKVFLNEGILNITIPKNYELLNRATEIAVQCLQQ